MMGETRRKIKNERNEGQFVIISNVRAEEERRDALEKMASSVFHSSAKI